MTDLQTFDLLLKRLAMRSLRGDDYRIYVGDFREPFVGVEVRGLEWVVATSQLQECLFRACVACAAQEPDVMIMSHAVWGPAWEKGMLVGRHNLEFGCEPLVSRCLQHAAGCLPSSTDAPSETDLSILKTWLNDAVATGRTEVDAAELESYTPCGVAAALPRLREWQDSGWLRLHEPSGSLTLTGLIEGRAV